PRRGPLWRTGVMKLPASLYGRYKDVKREGRRMVTKLRRGVPWAELAGDMIDTRGVPGMIFVDGPPTGGGLGEHFHMYVPARAIDDAIPHRLPLDAFVTLFEPAIATLWGFIALLGQSYPFLRPVEHKKRYLHALVRYWDELDAEGERYSTGASWPKRLWSLPTMLKHCLATLGLPKERCLEPLPPGGIRELINQTEARLH